MEFDVEIMVEDEWDDKIEKNGAFGCENGSEWVYVDGGMTKVERRKNKNKIAMFFLSSLTLSLGISI